MERLDRFWWALESVQGPAHSWVEWQRLLRSEFGSSRRFLRPTDRLATSYPCPDPSGQWCPRRVVDHGPGDVVAVCRDQPRRCDPVSVKRDELVIYELDLAALARELADGFGWDLQLREAEAQKAWQLGTLRSRGQIEPVYVTLLSDTSELESLAARLLATTESPLTLLTPTAASHSPRTRDLLSRASSRLLALEDLIEVTENGALAPSSSFSLPGDKPPAPSAHGFQQRGDSWLLRFDGHEAIVKDTKGLHYIQELLRNPGKAYHPSELEPVAGSPLAGARTARDDGLSSGGHRGAPELDDVAVEQYRKRLGEIEGELVEARDHNDPARAERLEAEKQAIENELVRSLDLRGRPRHGRTARQKSADRVTKAIREALGRLKATHRPLWKHLTTSIHTGPFRTYDPPKPVDWQF